MQLLNLVDNATQSYFNNKDELDNEFKESEERFTIGIVYDRHSGLLRVSDNAMGMSYEELTNALNIGLPPVNTSGRSKYGMGMKTASCWIGNRWSIRTTKLGETTENVVHIDVDRIAGGDNQLPYSFNEGISKERHYTVIEIHEHNKVFQGRTLGKIRDFLRSMYRQDLRKHFVDIEWQGSALKWDDSEYQFLRTPEGGTYKKEFDFIVNGKTVHGWVGILDRGSRGRAGFSILHADRVVRGWPDSWRPESLYGQFQGSNDLINQRLIGEIHLDEFEVSHTKDDVLWYGDEEEEVQDQLKKLCGDYAEVAKRRRKGSDDARGPTELEKQTAIDEFERELSSSELADIVLLETVPPPEAVAKVFQHSRKAVENRDPTFRATISHFEVLGYLMSDLSPNDPYVTVDSVEENRVIVIINIQHPHWMQLQGSEGVLNYFRHCTFDGIAEWQARRRAANLDPDTIKILKDRLLRLPGNYSPILSMARPARAI